MKRFIPCLAFACLTGLTVTSERPVIAGGCSGHINKTAEIQCAEDDTECQTEKTVTFDLKSTDFSLHWNEK